MSRRIKDSWLTAYLRYTDEQESPVAFHIWAAMSVLAATLERRVWLDRGYMNLFPNLYVMLIGPSGITRKTTAINIARDILRSLDTPPKMFSQKITPEALIQSIGEIERADNKLKLKATGIAMIPEMHVFLSKDAINKGMLTILTDLYDCPDEWTYETKAAGTFDLQNVALSMIAGTTPQWLKLAIPTEIVGGGFFSRCLFIRENKPKRAIPFPKKSDQIRRIQEKLIDDLEEIQQLSGEMTLTGKATDWYASWYMDTMEKIQHSTFGEFIVRWPDMLLKVAMLLSVAESDSLQIDVSHLELAQAMLNTAERQLPGIVTEVTAKQELPGQILQAIRAEVRTRRQNLYRMFYRQATKEEIDQAIDVLVQSGLVYTERHPGVGIVLVAEISKSEVTPDEPTSTIPTP